MPKSPHFKRTRDVTDLINEHRQIPALADTAWYKVGPSEPHNIGFTNSWGNAGVISGVTNAPAGWYLAEDGEVRLRGKITGGAAATVAFVLPVEVRPEYAETFICAVDGGGKANVTIHADGRVIVDTIGT